MYSYVRTRDKASVHDKILGHHNSYPQSKTFGRLSRTASIARALKIQRSRGTLRSVAGARRRVCAHCALVGPVHRHPCTPLYTVHTHSEDEKMCRIFSTKTVRMRVYVYILDDDICSFRPRRAPQCWRVSSPRLGRASSAGSRVPVTRLVEHRLARSRE